MTVTISIFAILMVILVINTILEHVTNYLIRKFWNFKDNLALILTLTITLMRWAGTVEIIYELMSNQIN
jgi:hypothetical protein